MKYFHAESISPHRSMTPEGFLVIHDAPLARIGVQYYAAGELNPEITPGPGGVVTVERDPG